MTADTSFWTPGRRALLSKAHKHLIARSYYPHLVPALRDLKRYDHLDAETLIHYGCGLLSDKQDYSFLIPYETGLLFYRSEGDQSSVLTNKDSKPDNSFFGSTTVTQKSSYLFITQRPFEAMLLWQKYGRHFGHDVISFIGPPELLTKEHRQWIHDEILGIKWRKIYFVTSLTEIETERTAKELNTCIKKIPIGPEFYLMAIDYQTNNKIASIEELLLQDNARDIFEYLIDETLPFTDTMAEINRIIEQEI